MDEAAIPEIDADMGKGMFEGIKKHQIAGLQLINRNGFAQLTDGAGTVWQGQVGRLAEYVPDKAAAIKTGVWRITAEFVWCAAERKCAHQNILHGRAGLFYDGTGLFDETSPVSRCLIRLAKAGGKGKQGCKNKGIKTHRAGFYRKTVAKGNPRGLRVES